jgi:hypothetical protein
VTDQLGVGVTEPPRGGRTEGGREELKGWVDGPPVIEHLDVIGSYNLFGTRHEEAAAR